MIIEEVKKTAELIKLKLSLDSKLEKLGLSLNWILHIIICSTAFLIVKHLMFVFDIQGAPPCTHYAQRGVCKFGPACKFDHPIASLSYSPSASSLADMPVALYPVASSIGTLALSSSSLELRPDLPPGSNNEADSVRVSSSISTLTGSVGFTLSTGEPVSQPNTQPSSQSSNPIAATTTTTSGNVSPTSS
ncbi:hypothetical protein TanjilG_20236 [Lupinus angustifolius]|uniref:C3H1-type domain-containing protein n=1 Tax=Lupinus angustifolius TaxID=3871 RepID=A0A1J7H5U4_LUPAN|nr:hypothetical protein TanjilG_20232 [Lupinus angustifolius]OIV95786.1 hypothetical protein TanjilG_20236 [Lupinus angustifolius]